MSRQSPLYSLPARANKRKMYCSRLQNTLTVPVDLLL